MALRRLDQSVLLVLVPVSLNVLLDVVLLASRVLKVAEPRAESLSILLTRTVGHGLLTVVASARRSLDFDHESIPILVILLIQHVLGVHVASRVVLVV